MLADVAERPQSRAGGGIESSRLASLEGDAGIRPLVGTDLMRKMVFDFCAALVLLLVLSPLLCVVAIAIKLDSRGSVLFRQPRTGLNDRPFICFKFRTMYHATADIVGARQTERNDPRVTRVGYWLRRLSIDEVPQLLNVLRGEMSLVGPRPHAVATQAGDRPLAEAVVNYSLRHCIRPGITGWAQVNGARGPVNSLADIERRVTFDLEYIARWSLRLDLRILMMTVRNEIFSSRAF